MSCIHVNVHWEWNAAMSNAMSSLRVTHWIVLDSQYPDCSHSHSSHTQVSALPPYSVQGSFSQLLHVLVLHEAINFRFCATPAASAPATTMRQDVELGNKAPDGARDNAPASASIEISKAGRRGSMENDGFASSGGLRICFKVRGATLISDLSWVRLLQTNMSRKALD
jgi:hypothetical protein